MTEPLVRDEAAAMLRAVSNLLRRWELKDTQAEILLGRPEKELLSRATQNEAVVPEETIKRVAALLGIHRSLKCLFSDPEQGYAWVRRPNSAFDGRTALERMLGGDLSDIVAVQQYLEAELSA